MCTRPKYAVQRLQDGKKFPTGHAYATPFFLNFRECDIVNMTYHGDFELYCQHHCKGIINVDYRPLLLPCGHCAQCRMSYSKLWAHRGLMEAFCHEQNCFLTLTLDDDALGPINDYDYELDKKIFDDNDKHGQYVRVDYLQKFFKRFRQRLYRDKKADYIRERRRREPNYHFRKGDVERPVIRYLACGEYGAENLRPHYHAIIFGWYPPDADYVMSNSVGDEIYQSLILNQLWPYGHIYIGDVTSESIAYVGGYVTKKQELITELEHLDGYYWKHLPFITMSRKPGLGWQFFEQFVTDFLDDRVRISDKQFQVPRYFIKQFEKYVPEVAEMLKQKRLKAAKDAKKTSAQLWHLDKFYDHCLSKKVRNL